MKLTPGTLMIEDPTAGCSQEDCLVCSGPDGDVREAFLAGMAAGIQALSEGKRPPFCIDHERYLRETLAYFEVLPEALTKLGIPFKIADEHTKVEVVEEDEP